VHNRWLCIEKGTYFGFYNEKARVYIGHDGRDGMLAAARECKEREMFSAHHNRDGGYEMQSQFYRFGKRVVNAAEDGESLVRMEHGRTLWVFAECLNVG